MTKTVAGTLSIEEYARAVVLAWSEDELQTRIISLARATGWKVAHFRKARTKRGWVTPVQGDGKGFPDLLMVRRDRQLVAELKSEKGIVDIEQLGWLDALAATGTPALIWRPRDWLSGEIERVLR